MWACLGAVELRRNVRDGDQGLTPSVVVHGGRDMALENASMVVSNHTGVLGTPVVRFGFGLVTCVCVLVCPKAGGGLGLRVPWLERHGR